MAKIELTIAGAFKKLNQAQMNLINMERLFKAIGDKELMETKLRFKDEKDPKGNKWEDSNTIRRDVGARRGGFTREQSWNYVLKSNFHAVPKGWHWFSRERGDKVLRDSGTLYNSITRTYTKDSATIGTNLSYAKKHQMGDGVKKRAFIGINQKTHDNIQNEIRKYFKGLLR